MELQVHRIKLRLSNAYVVELPTALVLVDAGSPGDTQKILSRLNAFGSKPLRLIYITHAHLDHYGAAASIQRATNAPLAIHAEDAGTMAKGETHLGHVRGRGRITATLMPIVRRLFPVEPVTADSVLQDGQDLGDFGLPGQVLHTPGHTPGSTSLIVDDRLAFVGDLFSTFGKPHTQRLYA
ncbi:MAG: MBL fold metallo-hydrolase, partial [Anaerolineales bacterium]